MLRPGPGQHAGRRAPHRPGAEQAEGEGRLHHQRGHRMPAAAGRHEAQRHAGLALARRVAPGGGAARARAVLEAQGQRMALMRGVVHHHLQPRRLAGKTRRRGPQVQRQPAQVAVCQVHGHQPRAGQQESQRIAQVELVVDGRQQHHQQRAGEGEPGPRGQDVDVALAQLPGVGERQPGLPPSPEPCPGRGRGERTQWPPRNRLRRAAGGAPLGGSAEGASGGGQGMATASTIARTCSTGPRPAPATGTSRCATACGRMACTSSGET
jgi:hypothetical protein